MFTQEPDDDKSGPKEERLPVDPDKDFVPEEDEKEEEFEDEDEDILTDSGLLSPEDKEFISEL